MPWTFSHPIAVIPLQRIFHGRLNLSALMIGSLSPDFAYYGKQFSIATDAHTLSGLFLICLPTGLVVLALFYRLRESFCFLLPNPHRTALMPLALRRPAWSIRNFGIASGSIILGASTHLAWDSFTHHGGWIVAQVPILSDSSIQIGSTSLPLYYFLQQGSTIAGAVALFLLYFHWLRRQPVDALSEAVSDRGRYWLLLVLVVMAAMIAAPFAIDMALQYKGYFAFRVFVFRFAVYSTMAFLPLFAIGSLLFSKFGNGVHVRPARNQ